MAYRPIWWRDSRLTLGGPLLAAAALGGYSLYCWFRYGQWADITFANTIGAARIGPTDIFDWLSDQQLWAVFVAIGIIGTWLGESLDNEPQRRADSAGAVLQRTA